MQSGGKRLAGNIKSRKLLEAAEVGDVTLMAEMKRILGRKDTGQTVPESLDGKVTHDTILERNYTTLQGLRMPWPPLKLSSKTL